MTNELTAEIIAIGSELLSGDTIDTNSAQIARMLRGIGFELRFISAVGDDETLIAEVVARGLARSHVVMTTGGLGPTVDDKTRAAVSQATGRPLLFRPNLLEQIESRFGVWGKTMSDNNRTQAYTPEGALSIENQVGTAPCFILKHKQSRIICLPGVPNEMNYLMEYKVLPYLRRSLPNAKTIKTRVLHTVGLGESVVDSKIGDLEALDNPTVGLTAHVGVVDIRITSSGDETEANHLIAQVEDTVRKRLGASIFGSDGDSLESVVLRQIEGAGLSLSTVESGTRGQLAEKLAKADDGRGIFQVGAISPKLTSSSDLETSVVQMSKDCLMTHRTDISLASVVVRRKNRILFGVALGRAETGATISEVRGYGGHIDHAGELSAHVALNLLLTKTPNKS